jgi:thioesterase domain-containing protein/acyl carrier protein
MGGGLGEADLARLGRLGIAPLSSDQGLELLDMARTSDEPLLMPVRLEMAALRAQARAGMLPASLRGIVRTPARRATNGGSLAGRLAELPESEWDAAVLELVRGLVAAVLGHASPTAVAVDRSMHELGLDSLSAVELRNRLSHATGLRLPATIAFDAPTPVAMARYLRERVEQQGHVVRNGAVPAPAPGEAAGTFGALLRSAHERGAISDVIPLLLEASKLRPAFGSLVELERPPRLATLSGGDLAPILVCLPSFLPGSGPHQFARLAHGVGAAGRVSALSLPGFRPAESVPRSWSVAVEALAESVRGIAEREPFVLVGYSTGGTLAHALAGWLENESLPPAGVVLLDTYTPAAETEWERREVLAGVLSLMVERDHELMSLDDDNLLAMASYVRLLEEWEPASIAAPLLLIRASEALGGASGASRLPPGQVPDEIVEVAGDHFALIEHAAEETARAIMAWVGSFTAPAGMTEAVLDGTSR